MSKKALKDPLTAKVVVEKGESPEGSSHHGGKKCGWDAIEELFDDKKAKRESDRKDDVEKEKRKKKKVSRSIAATGEWVDDGLGGVYNTEGFTGRVEEGVKVFKAHVLNKPNSGQSAQCPFDCDCCFI